MSRRPFVDFHFIHLFMYEGATRVWLGRVRTVVSFIWCPEKNASYHIKEFVSTNLISSSRMSEHRPVHRRDLFSDKVNQVQLTMFLHLNCIRIAKKYVGCSIIYYMDDVYVLYKFWKYFVIKLYFSCIEKCFMIKFCFLINGTKIFWLYIHSIYVIH